MTMSRSVPERAIAASLRRAHGSDLSKPGAIGEPQFASEAIVAYTEVPDPLRNRAGELTTLRYEATAEDPHVLFPATDDLACVDRQAICRLHRCDSIHDHLVVACRRAHQAHRCTTPGSHGRCGRRRRGGRLRDRRARERGSQRDAGYVDPHRRCRSKVNTTRSVRHQYCCPGERQAASRC